MSYYVYLTRENNCFVADVPALPGCRTLGRSEAEALENIRDVIRGYLRNMRKKNLALPKVKVVKLSEEVSLMPGSRPKSFSPGALPDSGIPRSAL
ncbi:MAG: type II toxin-antitoxin system HicB family antitoxin [Candidatus Manganitrophaceae bacterium]